MLKNHAKKSCYTEGLPNWQSPQGKIYKKYPILYQGMPDHFQALEIMFTVHETCWKHHKSKDNNFLHRSYTPKQFSTPKKNIFRASSKKSSNILVEKKTRQNLQKSEIENFQMLKIENCDFFVENLSFFGGFFSFFLTRKNFFLGVGIFLWVQLRCKNL